MADFFTVKMLPLFYPLTKQNFGIPLVLTGGIMEKIFTLVVAGFNVFLAYKVFVDYWLVNKLVFPSYDKYLVYGSIAASLFVFWGLFRQELADIKRYPMQIVSRLFKTAAFFAVNLIVSLGVAFIVKTQYLTQVALLLKSVQLGFTPEFAVMVAFGLSMVPSVIKVAEGVDKTSFLFATVVNTVLVILITALLIGNAGDLSGIISGVALR